MTCVKGNPKDARKIGLARALSKLGFCSRSQAAQMIREGRAQGKESVRLDPETPVRIEQDRIRVDGREIEAEAKVYLMMNKPRGLVTTASDEKGRETVYSILAKSRETLPWVAPVGRLDKASEGLLLLTNDSEWGARIAAPETHLEKTYHVQIGTVAGDPVPEALVRGVNSEGELLKARQVRVLRSGGKNSWLEITLDEGKNRHIRRMLEALGVEVPRLRRVANGAVPLGHPPKSPF